MRAEPSEFRNLLRLSLQAVFVQITLMSMTMIDIIMAGRHSEEVISAVSLGTNLLHPMTILVYGLFCAVNPLAAELNGKKAYSQLAKLILTACYLALFLAPIYMLVMQYSHYIIQLVNINEDLIPLVYDYLKSLSYGMPAFLLFLCLRFFNDGLFKSKNVLIVTLIVAPVNVFFNWVWLYGKLGFAELGVAGLAYSTVVSWSLLALLMLLFTLRHQDIRLPPLRACLPNFAMAKQLFKLGLPISGSIALELFFLCLIGLLAGQYLVTTIAAHQIAISLCFIFLMIPLGVATAVTARTGYFYSQHNMTQVSMIHRLTLIYVASMGILVCGVMLLGSGFLVAIYSNEPQVQKQAQELVFYAALIQLPAGLFYALSGYLRGLKHTLPALYISLFVYWGIGFPLAYWLSEYRGAEVAGLWQGLLVAYLFAAGLLLLVARKRSQLEVKKEAAFVLSGQVN